nr:hypothetical protein [Clostridioides sp.]
MDVTCVDDWVDGITEGKDYSVLEVLKRSDGVFYGILDDYGVLNHFRAKRFKIKC